MDTVRIRIRVRIQYFYNPRAGAEHGNEIRAINDSVGLLFIRLNSAKLRQRLTITSFLLVFSLVLTPGNGTPNLYRFRIQGTPPR